MSLRTELAATLARTPAVLGVGNPCRGDDGAGSAVARALAAAGATSAIDGGEIPESYIADVARLGPDSVLIVDAVEMGAEPGSVAVVDPPLLARLATDTHRVPLELLIRVLADRTGARCHVLAIQPAQTTLGAGLSPAVAETVDDLVRELGQLLPPPASAPGPPETARRRCR